MHFDPNKTYFMPVSVGPARPLTAGVFDDVLSLQVSYVTDKDVLAALLPAPFEPADQPLVTAYFRKCSGVNFLAGGCYSMMGLNLAAYFNGRQDQVRGDYALVLWENHIFPILRGRELLGVPKLPADIPDPLVVGNDWSAQASDGGNLLLRLSIRDAKKVGAAALEQMRLSQKSWHWLSWRYIPTVDGVGAALSEPTLIGWEGTTSEAWTGSGTIGFGDVTWEASPMNGDILPVLKTLVVREYVESTITRGPATLTRALHRVLH